MASHETDPHRAEPPLSSDDEGRTDPGDATMDEGSSAFAQSLLADLARAPLPADNVRETEGHAAAAYAVAPHRPPRANEKTIETAAVVVETTTEPVPRPLPAVQETTVPGARLVATAPSARARSSRRVLFASIGGAAVAAAIAIAVVVLGEPSHPAPPPAPTATASMTAPADPPPASPATNSTASTADPAPAASPSAAASVSTSSMIATPAAPRPTAKPAPSARPSAPSTARPAKPSGNFAEPDRSF